MKKILFLAVLLFAGTLTAVHAQLALVYDAAVHSLALSDSAEKAIYYAQSLYQMGESALNTYNQFQNMIRMEQMALNNLKNIANVHSYKDFMEWSNRQLYLERQAEQSLTNTVVNIGGRTYRLKDIKDIPDALNNFGDGFWESDFSEAQRRQMWYNLGLNPANYAYQETWRTRRKALTEKMLVKREISYDDYMKEMERNNEYLNEIAGDKNKPEDSKMGEKKLSSMNVETNIANNKVLNDMKTDNAEFQDLIVTLILENETPANQPRLSEHWDESPFGPITE